MSHPDPTHPKIVDGDDWRRRTPGVSPTEDDVTGHVLIPDPEAGPRPADDPAPDDTDR